jgi:hypothetical protein
LARLDRSYVAVKGSKPEIARSRSSGSSVAVTRSGSSEFPAPLGGGTSRGQGRVAWSLWSAYAKQADRRDRERARDRYRAGMRLAAAQHPRLGWLEWLRNRAGHGDAEALTLLRSRGRREPQVPIRAVWSHGAPLRNVGGDVDGVTATGSMLYAGTGGRIRDDGQRLRLSGPRSVGRREHGGRVVSPTRYRPRVDG